MRTPLCWSFCFVFVFVFFPLWALKEREVALFWVLATYLMRTSQRMAVFSHFFPDPPF